MAETFEPLYESANFSIDCADEFEPVYLSGPGVPQGLVIAYSDYFPPAVAIDVQERWCVMVGRGVIVYRLSAPWLPFLEDPPPYLPPRPFHNENWGLPKVRGTEQWWDYGRPEQVFRNVDSVVHVEGERFEAVSDEPRDEGPTRWAIMAESRTIRALNWLPDIP
jgi:hypothetical protein